MLRSAAERLWQQRLQPRGIEVERLSSLRDWSESRVLYLEGRRHGERVTCYLKSSRRGMERETGIYRFAATHPEFPAPEAICLSAEGEEWLLIDQAAGIPLADVARAGRPEAYVDAAREMARFHSRSTALGWTVQLASLRILGEQLERLRSDSLESVRRKVAQGIYMGVDLPLLLHVEAESAHLWPGLLENYRSYPEAVIHGDCHDGNLFLAPEGTVSMIDWASASIAPGLMDLAALVDVNERMRAPLAPVKDVLNAYLDELSRPEREAYGQPERAWTTCRTFRAFLELEWFATTGEDYGERAQRELTLLRSLLRI